MPLDEVGVAVAEHQVVDVTQAPDVLGVGPVLAVEPLLQALPRGVVVEVPRLVELARDIGLLDDSEVAAVVGVLGHHGRIVRTADFHHPVPGVELQMIMVRRAPRLGHLDHVARAVVRRIVPVVPAVAPIAVVSFALFEVRVCSRSHAVPIGGVASVL